MFNVKEPHASSKLFGLPILLENQNVAAQWLSLKIFSWIIVVLDLDIIFSWWPTCGLKLDIKFEETNENMSFSALFTTSNTWLVQTTAEYQKDTDICHSPWQIYNLHQYHVGIRMCSIHAKCWKSSEMAKVAYFCSFYWIWVPTSSPKGNDRSPESNVPRSNLISKTYKWAMETRGPKSNSSVLLCLSWLPATLMTTWSKMNELECRRHVPILSL